MSKLWIFFILGHKSRDSNQGTQMKLSFVFIYHSNIERIITYSW